MFVRRLTDDAHPFVAGEAPVIAGVTRLELILAAANSIQNQKNFNSGGVIADETIADSRTVTVALFHDVKRRSALYVPIALQQTPGTTQ